LYVFALFTHHLLPLVLPSEPSNHIPVLA
jgi:hypothetical protein